MGSPDAARLPSRRDASRTAEAEGLGLVSSQTSVTRQGQIVVDPRGARLSRMRSRVLTASRLHCQQVSRWRVAMVTPTYRPGVEWSPLHMTQAVRCMREWLRRRGVCARYVWVMELTKRGRPHYHLLVWLPWGVVLPKFDEAGWWPHGMTKAEWARNAIGYIAKYASKGDSEGKMPEGARLHGNGGLTGEALLEQRWWAKPTWLRDQVAVGDVVRRRAGGGWVDADTGEVFRSPWLVRFEGGFVVLSLASAADG